MVNVLISADSKFPVSRLKIRKAIVELLEAKRITLDIEVSILICGRRKSQELAKKYLKDDKPHNVLSFPLIEDTKNFVSPTGKSVIGFAEQETLTLGDIVICYPLAQIDANDDDMRVDDKINELVQHGLLHLLGEHHE